MTDEPFTEMSLWRNYKQGRVGFQIEGRHRLLLTPNQARQKAALLEMNLEQLPEDQRDQGREIISDMRQFADDVEGC